MDLLLKKKRAIITGGSRGLGREIARQLAAEGADIAILARDEASAIAEASEIQQTFKVRAAAFAADVGKDEDVSAVVEKAAQLLGGLDILINNAATPGGGKAAAIADVSIEGLLRDINIKTGGFLRMARAVVPHMKAGGWGRIINIGGIAARVSGNYNAGIRCASVSALTKNLADELGGSGISAVAIHPHLLRSDALADDYQNRIAATTTNGILYEAADVAWLVTMLASPRNVVVNGETIQAGGGYKGVINY